MLKSIVNFFKHIYGNGNVSKTLSLTVNPLYSRSYNPDSRHGYGLSSIQNTFNGFFSNLSNDLECSESHTLHIYMVGPYTIKICNVGDSYLYISELNPKPPERLLVDIRSKISMIMKDIPDDKEITDHDLMEIIADILDIEREYIEVALYLIKQYLGYGKLQVLLDDTYVEDISISGPGPVWVRLSNKLVNDPKVDMVKTNISLSLTEVLALQQYIANRSGYYVSQSNPIVDVQMPIRDGGHRVHIVAPIIAGSRPEIAIRKRIKRRITIKDLIELSTLNRAIELYLKEIIENNGSILIAGPPSSGKTTLLKAILYSYIPYSWKVVIIEDTPEIDPPEDSSWIRYNTFELGKLTIDQFTLAKAALRSSVSKVIVIGETRGSEAQVLSQALNMGMIALTTFHGGSTNEVITRLSSPPINLTLDQIANIWVIATMGFRVIDNFKCRVLVNIDELFLNDGRLRIHNIYNIDRDQNVDSRELINRSIRLKSIISKQ